MVPLSGFSQNTEGIEGNQSGPFKTSQRPRMESTKIGPQKGEPFSFYATRALGWNPHLRFPDMTLASVSMGNEILINDELSYARGSRVKIPP